MKKAVWLLLVLLFLAGGLSAQQPVPTPDPPFKIVCAFQSSNCPVVVTETPVSSATLGMTPSATRTVSPTPTRTVSPTVTPTLTVTPSVTRNPLPTQTATLEATPTGEIFSAGGANGVVNGWPSPLFSTEVYSVKPGSKALYDALPIQLTRVEVEAGSVFSNGAGTDFASYHTPADMEKGAHGWSQDQGLARQFVLDRLGSKKPIMMLMHYGAESYMGNIPDAEKYSNYFLGTVYYYNVLLNRNYTLWEVLNEPDWGWSGNRPSPQQYADIFKRVADKVKAFPDTRVSGILIGGPVLGSGDPIDGTYPTGYANKTNDQGRQWRLYIPTLIQTVPNGIGFLSYHDYGDTWGLPNNVYNFDQEYELVNRVNAFASGYKVGISEFNFDAGPISSSNPDNFTLYRNFRACLWTDSALTQYASTGKVLFVSKFDWEGPKGLTLSEGHPLPVYWCYKDYVAHVQPTVIAALNGLTNRWADVLVTASGDGKVIEVIAVNKSADSQSVDLTFNVPPAFGGDLTVQQTVTVAAGSGEFGTVDLQPLQTTRTFAVPLAAGRQLHYGERLPGHTIVRYTLVTP